MHEWSRVEMSNGNSSLRSGRFWTVYWVDLATSHGKRSMGHTSLIFELGSNQLPPPFALGVLNVTHKRRPYYAQRYVHQFVSTERAADQAYSLI